MSNKITRKGDLVIVKDKKNGVDLSLPLGDVINILKREGKKEGININVDGETVEFNFTNGQPGAEMTLDEFLQLSLEVIENGSEVRNIN